MLKMHYFEANVVARRSILGFQDRKKGVS